MVEKTRKVTILGGGVAALEALLALRSIADPLLEIELIAAEPHFSYRPLAVAEPFGLGTAHRFDLTRITAEHGARLHVAGVEAIDPDLREVLTWDGRRFDYDILVVALGTRRSAAVPGSVTLGGPGYTNRFRTVLRDLDLHKVHTIAFAVPVGASWPLPLYELALMTAAHVADRGLRKVALHIATHEARPLDLFGNDAADELDQLLHERSIALHPNRIPIEARDEQLILAPGPSLDAERVVSLPRLYGPAVAGLPANSDGFIPVDPHGRVVGLEDVYAAGDATTSPLKQGGIATQQADAVAESIAALTGSDIDPEPFRPVLRGLLLTGGAPKYIRAEVAGGKGERWDVSDQALWWPPSKIAGRFLAPYLATHRKDLEPPVDGIDVEVALDAGQVHHRAIIAPADGSAKAFTTDE